VLVTGAGSGMGAACLRRLHAEGATVVAMDVQLAGLEAAARTLGAPDRIHLVEIDVVDHAAVAGAVADVANRIGGLYGLVNCAGVRGIGRLTDWTPEQWRRVVAVNLDGTFNLCQAFARELLARKSRGAIVNLSSTAGIRAVPNRLAYVAAKMGVSGITQSMALELGPAGIRVNAVAPGLVDRPGLAEDWPEGCDWWARTSPLGRTIHPTEVADAISFLATATGVSGVVLPVDGGWSASARLA